METTTTPAQITPMSTRRSTCGTTSPTGLPRAQATTVPRSVPAPRTSTATHATVAITPKAPMSMKGMTDTTRRTRPGAGAGGGSVARARPHSDLEQDGADPCLGDLAHGPGAHAVLLELAQQEGMFLGGHRHQQAAGGLRVEELSLIHISEPTRRT